MEMKFNERHFTPRILGVDAKDILLKADRYRDCAVIGQALISLIQNHDLSFVDLEKMYRDMESDTYLLAAPKEKMLPKQISLDIITREEMPYWLWICVNGEDEAKQTMSEFKIKSYEDNINKLKETGVLAMDI